MGVRTYYFDVNEINASENLCLKITNYLSKDFAKTKGLVIFCIGTDRITGDSLGPLVGYKIKKYELNNVYVYGTLDEPVHALNVDKIFNEVQKKHPSLPVIAIDASLGHSSHLGCVTVSKGALKPGIGVKKKLKQVGDISITGIVCASSPLANMELQTTRLSMVMKLADCISDSLSMVANNFLNVAATKK